MMRTKTSLCLLSILISCVCSQPIVAIDLVTPSSVTLDASSQYFSIGNLVNGSGLSGAATINNYTTLTHAAASGTTAWTTNASGGDYYAAPVGPTPVMTFDLGGQHQLSHVAMWGYHFGSPNNNEAKNFTFEFSTDGVTFGSPVSVSHNRTAALQQTNSLGSPITATHVRASITDNHRGLAGANGGDRVGLGEIKFISADATAANVAAGKSYSYTTLPTFSGGTYYIDDPHIQVPGAYSPGDLTDGATHPSGSAPTTGPVNTLVGWGDPVNIPTEIIFDLDGLHDLDSVTLGTHTWAPFANGAPDDVTVSFSTTGDAPGDFTDDILVAFGAPGANGHHDLLIDLPEDTLASFLKLNFDGGAVLAGNTPNKWMLDEVSIFGSEAAPVPEPASIAIWSLLGLCLAGYGYRRRRNN